ncbi:MAG: acylphosphatase [Bacteroidetes bacterium]|nr:MAG: acylphosphatase [Bacteroidota bacterium]
MPGKKTHYNIHIKGSVQNIGFLFSACYKANTFGIKGFATYRDETSVYMEAEGDRQKLDDFIKWCCKGPAGSEIKKVDTEEGIFIGFADFIINEEQGFK